MVEAAESIWEWKITERCVEKSRDLLAQKGTIYLSRSTRTAWSLTDKEKIMKQRVLHAIFILAVVSCTREMFAETIDVRLRIRQRKAEEVTITRENLIQIQQFILKLGKRETYCQMYNNNPAYGTKSYRFYLNPDTGQKNINCDPNKSGFHNLTIRSSDGGKNQYREVEFLDKYYIYIMANWPTPDLDVQKIRTFVEDAMKEILAEIEKKGPNRPDADGGK
jgi:hypothetical protein